MIIFFNFQVLSDFLQWAMVQGHPQCEHLEPFMQHRSETCENNLESQAQSHSKCDCLKALYMVIGHEIVPLRDREKRG